MDKNGLVSNGPINVYCTDGGTPMSRNTLYIVLNKYRLSNHLHDVTQGIQFTVTDANDAAYAHYTWPVQTGVYSPQG